MAFVISTSVTATLNTPPAFKIILFTSISVLYSATAILPASSSLRQIENLQEQLRDKDKQLGNLKDRVKSLQTDSSNTDTALATLEEALSEKVWYRTVALEWMQ